MKLLFVLFFSSFALAAGNHSAPGAADPALGRGGGAASVSDPRSLSGEWKYSVADPNKSFKFSLTDTYNSISGMIAIPQPAIGASTVLRLTNFTSSDGINYKGSFKVTFTNATSSCTYFLNVELSFVDFKTAQGAVTGAQPNNCGVSPNMSYPIHFKRVVD